MVKRILLLGRKGIVVSDAQAQIDDDGIEIYTGTNIDDVRSCFNELQKSQQAHFDHVFMGAGIDLDKRVEIINAVFELSDKTTVHMKDAASGPQGMLPFVKAVLAGLKNSNL